MAVTAGVQDFDADDEDLSVTLRHVGKDKLLPARARLANTPETRAFLELGLGLLIADLVDHTGPDFEQGLRSPLFESLSRQRILALAGQTDVTQPLHLSDNMFRNRWTHKNDYTEDLIAYLFRTGPQERHIEEMREAAAELIKDASLGDLVRSLAAAEMAAITADPLSAVQAIVQAALPSHPRVQEFARAQYDFLLPLWAQLYEEVTAAYGLTLVDRYTWSDVALLFNSVAESAFLRRRAEGQEPQLTSGDGVLVGAIFVMLPTLLVSCPADLDNCYSTGRVCDTAGQR
jgi:hypothetical protein